MRTFTCTTLSLGILAGAALLTLGGCGPTAHGKKMRTEAQQRLDQFGAQFRYDQALQEFEAGQFENAQETLTGSIASLPEEIGFRILLGRVFVELGDLQAAKDSFDVSIELDADSAEAHYYLGIVLQRWSRDDEALEAYRKAYDLEPGNVQYLLAAAEMLVAMSQWDEAHSIVESRIAYFEHDTNLRQILGQIALLEGDPERAERLYREARMFEPDNDRLLEELAHVQWAAGNYADCLASVRTLCERHPDVDRIDLKRLEARCATMIGRRDDAHRLYRELTRSLSSDADIWIEFGAVAWELGDFARLGECGRRSTSLAPDRFEGWIYSGLVAREHGRLDEAMHLFKEAAARTTTSPMPQLLIGRLEELRGASAAAVTSYHAALGIDPDCTEARRLLAHARADGGS